MSCTYGTIYTSGDYIDCSGEKSCFNSILYHYSTGYTLLCGGFESCMLTNIYAKFHIEWLGLFSGKKSYIQSHDTDNRFIFEGALSGYGATIVCNDGHTCVVRCYGDNCNDLTLIELGGTFSVTCYYDAKQSSVCPNGKQLSSFMYEIPNLVNLSISDSDQNEYICNPDYESINAIHCSNRKECEYDSHLTNNNNGTICCSADDGCRDISNLVLNGTNNPNQTSVRCDAVASCQSSTITVINGGDIYLSGHYSCHSCTITATAISNIFCSGTQCGTSTQINHVRSLYCLAFVSCYTSNVLSIYQNAYLYGYHSGYGIDITNVVGNIYCNGYQSCYGSYVINVGGDVYGSGYQSLYSSTIQNVNNSVLAFGYESLALSNINSIYNLYIDGTYCFDSSVVTSVHNVKVNGTNSLTSSTITSYLTNSGNSDDNIFTIKIYSSNSESFTLTCSHNDICYIGCFGSGSCIGMNLICLSGTDSCFVHCDNNITGCPGGSSYSEWVIESDNPTASPTDTPSSIPTHPTISPTNVPSIPTNIPTNTPTNLTLYPTYIPTDVPSSNPTTIPTVTRDPTNNPIRFINPSTIPTYHPAADTTSTTHGKSNATSTTDTTDNMSTIGTIGTADTTAQTETTAQTDTTNATPNNPVTTDLETTNEGTENGSDTSPSTTLIFSSSNTFFLAIILAIIFLCLVCGCWILTYCLFKVKADSKIRENEIQSQLQDNLNMSKQLKANRLKKFRSVELGSVHAAQSVRSASPSIFMNETDIAYNHNTAGGNDDDDEDNNHSVSKLFDTTNGQEDIDNEKGEDDKEELALHINHMNDDINVDFNDNGDVDGINNNDDNIKDTSNIGENNTSDNVNIEVEDEIDDVMADNDNKNKVVTKGNNSDDQNDNEENGIGIIGSLDENRYKQWSKKEVLVWLKENLLNNGFTKERSKEFLKEFNKMGITGGSLDAFKNYDANDKKFDKLIKQFSKKNQEFGVWLVIQTCIENINAQHAD